MGNTPQTREVDFTKLNFARLAHSYSLETGKNLSIDELNHFIRFVDYICAERSLPKYKVAVMFVCINQPYWQYGPAVIEGVRNYFLPGHDVDILMWADLAEYPEAKDVTWGADKVFPTESIGWPYPTLMRYHLFLQQEEYLKQYDYIFYLDLDMRVVNIVGDEIFGDGLTAAQHPMYAIRQNLWYPYEPNPASTAHFKQPGKVIEKDGKALFVPLYAAGGFQGGKTDIFIDAMKTMQKNIDTDFANGYVARWNDESHWNRYLFDNPPSVVLDPSYVYPDSMIDTYYRPIWGRDYTPRIITLTKPFTTSKEGGQAAREMIRDMQGL